jgi:hypothetical protein
MNTQAQPTATTTKKPRTHRVPKGTMAAALVTAGVAAPATPHSLAEAEQLNLTLPIKEQWVSYRGEFMSRESMEAMANAALAESKAETTITQGVSYFDLIETLQSLLAHEMLKARVLSSMAWGLDTAAINVARNVFWTAHAEATETGSIDDFNNFVNKFKEMRANENYVEDLGFELNSGPIQSLALMVKLSQGWHDAAMGAAANAGMRYTPKTFEVLLNTEKPQAVKADTIVKLNMIVDSMYEDDADADPKEIQDAKDRLAEMQRMRAIDQHDSRQRITPAVLRVIDYATYHGSSADSFWQLPIDLQARLINQAISAIERSITDLAGYSKITAVEYIGIIKEAKAAIKQLNETVKHGKFAAH